MTKVVFSPINLIHVKTLVAIPDLMRPYVVYATSSFRIMVTRPVPLIVL